MDPERLPTGEPRPRLVKALRGHSNCDVLLLAEGRSGRIFVRKRAREPRQNDRLQSQCAKQTRAFAEGMAVPAVHASALRDGLFQFDMDYVRGMTVAHACLAARDVPSRDLFRFLAEVLNGLGARCEGAIPADRFVAKIGDIATACETRPPLAPLRGRIAALADSLAGAQWEGIPRTACHGDLTLENVMMARHGGFCLIDLDVPELCSTWLDLAKLRQDTHGLWCLRTLVTEAAPEAQFRNAYLRLAPLRRLVDELVETLAPEASARMPQLTAFHLLRTLPYCRDAATGGFVLDRAEALIAG